MRTLELIMVFFIKNKYRSKVIHNHPSVPLKKKRPVRNNSFIDDHYLKLKRKTHNYSTVTINVVNNSNNRVYCCCSMMICF